MQIPGLAGLDPGTVLQRALKEFLDHDMLTQASALAYQALFSLFPFITLSGGAAEFSPPAQLLRLAAEPDRGVTPAAGDRAGQPRHR